MSALLPRLTPALEDQIAQVAAELTRTGAQGEYWNDAGLSREDMTRESFRAEAMLAQALGGYNDSSHRPRGYGANDGGVDVWYPTRHAAGALAIDVKWISERHAGGGNWQSNHLPPVSVDVLALTEPAPNYPGRILFVGWLRRRSLERFDIAQMHGKAGAVWWQIRRVRFNPSLNDLARWLDVEFSTRTSTLMRSNK